MELKTFIDIRQIRNRTRMKYKFTSKDSSKSPRQKIYTWAISLKSIMTKLFHAISF